MLTARTLIFTATLFQIVKKNSPVVLRAEFPGRSNSSNNSCRARALPVEAKLRGLEAFEPDCVCLVVQSLGKSTVSDVGFHTDLRLKINTVHPCNQETGTIRWNKPASSPKPSRPSRHASERARAGRHLATLKSILAGMRPCEKRFPKDRITKATALMPNSEKLE